MKDLLTPKQVARALAASESSVKRWCDKGVIPAHTTAGGHRRISLSALLEFVRGGKYELVHPEALGLPPTSGQTTRVVDRAQEQMTSSLIAGDELRCRQIVIDLYLAEVNISVICDDVFGAAFQQIGDRWACGAAEVYQERRGCEIAIRVLNELRSFVPAIAIDAPLAIGGAATGNPYRLGSTMAELVLRHAQWNAVSLGDNLPFATLAAAIREHQPRLFWLSCTHIADQAEFLEGYGQLHQEFGTKIAFVVGGLALTDQIRQQMKYSAYCDTMQHLEEFANTLRRGIIVPTAE